MESVREDFWYCPSGTMLLFIMKGTNVVCYLEEMRRNYSEEEEEEEISRLDQDQDQDQEQEQEQEQEQDP